MNAKNCFFGILFLASCAFTQEGWKWQNPLPQGNSLRSVHFLDANTGWAVGDLGTILKTIDGGISWIPQSSRTIANLTSVTFVDASIGYAVGTNGVILKTGNGGTNWFPQNSNTPQGLTSVLFLNATTGYITGGGGVILKTTNGGITWIAQTSGVNKNLYAVSFPDSNTGFAVGDSGTILKTTNGGNSWTIQSIGTTNNFNSLSFVNDSVGWAAGSARTIQFPATVFKTRDGGKTWTSIYSDKNLTGYSSMYFTDTSTGYLSVEHADILVSYLILKTIDGGKNWTTVSGSDWPVYSFHFTDPDHGGAVGYGGTILTTSNGGSSWTSKSPGVRQFGTLTSVRFLNENTGFSVGNSIATDVVSTAFLRTNDGGKNWAIKAGYVSGTFQALDYADTNIGYAVGYSGIVKTVDGGSTWNSQATGTFYAIDVVNANTAWAVGAGGVIRRTTDGGNHWISQTSGTGADLNSVFFLDSATGYAVGKPGTIVKTIDGGNTWVTKFSYSGVATGFNSVYFLNAGQGWVTGETGIIMHTADSGKTWIRQTSNTTNTLNSVRFMDANTGYAVGNSGTIVESTNGGTTWIPYSSGTSSSLYSLSFADETHGWTVGDNGTILATVPMQPPSNLLYSRNSVAYSTCYTIPTLYASASGNITGFSIAPPLPSGLTLNTTTGAISGTPTESNNVTKYNVIAFNAVDSAQAELDFLQVAIDDFSPPSLAYSANLATYTTGTKITPNVPTATGPCSITGYSVTPALPTGLKLDSVTGTISGTPTTVAAAANYTVTLKKATRPDITTTLTLTVNNPVNGISSVALISEALLFSGRSVSFRLPANMKSAQLSITDVWGRSVWKQKMEAGMRQAIWNGNSSEGLHTATGIYFVQVNMLDSEGNRTSFGKQFVYAP